MFHLTLMSDVKHLFEGFSILTKNGDKIDNIYSYPTNYLLNKYYEFIFPCDCPKEKTEEYTIVISNNYNSRSFIVCRYSDFHKIYLCIYSNNPWFEILSKILINLCSTEYLKNHNEIEKYLDQIFNLDDKNYVTLPASGFTDKAPQDILKNTLKHPFVYDKYIQEYLTAIKPKRKYNKQLWIEVFWSMLLERPVIFMSKRYQKLTASLIAAIFFIHPLSWLHKIVSIIPKKSPELLGMNCCMLGIHNCMKPILEKADYWNEALLVDLDEGESRMVGACDDEKETQKRFKVPKYIKNFFINSLTFVDESVSKHSPNRIRNLISNVAWDINNKEETMYNEYKKGFHIYSLLFRTVIAILIGHYRECISESGGNYKFDKKKFIEYNEKISDFLELLVNSQCFDSFIDERLKIIQNNEDLNDRFDRERLELNLKEKNKVKPYKFDKKNRIPDGERKKKASFHSVTAFATSESLCSSTVSLDFNNKRKMSAESSDCLSIKSESLTSEIYKSLVENNIIESNSAINRDSILSSITLTNSDGNLKTSMYNQDFKSPGKLNVDNIFKKAPERPTKPPRLPNKIILKPREYLEEPPSLEIKKTEYSTIPPPLPIRNIQKEYSTIPPPLPIRNIQKEIPVGRVRGLVQKMNSNCQDRNNISVPKFTRQPTTSELQPQITKPRSASLLQIPSKSSDVLNSK